MKRTKSLTVVGIMSLILVLASLLLVAAPAPGIAGEKGTKNIGKHRGQVFILDIYYRRESGVSQASRRVAQKIEKDKKLKKRLIK